MVEVFTNVFAPNLLPEVRRRSTALSTHALDVWIHVTFPLFYRRVAPLYEASISGSTLIPTECWVCYIAPRAWHDSMAFSHHRLSFFTLVSHA
jgi:hypothetical protein